MKTNPISRDINPQREGDTLVDTGNFNRMVEKANAMARQGWDPRSVIAVQDSGRHVTALTRNYPPKYTGPFACDIRNDSSGDPTELYIAQGYIITANTYSFPETLLSDTQITVSATNYVYLDIECDPNDGTIPSAAYVVPRATTDDTDLHSTTKIRFLLAQVDADASKYLDRTSLYQRWQGGDLYLPVSYTQSTYPDIASNGTWEATMKVGMGHDIDTDT